MAVIGRKESVMKKSLDELLLLVYEVERAALEARLTAFSLGVACAGRRRNYVEAEKVARGAEFRLDRSLSAVKEMVAKLRDGEEQE